MMANFYSSDYRPMPHYNMKPFTRSSKINNLNPPKELLPLRDECANNASLFSGRSRVNVENIFSTDNNYLNKKRFPKSTLPQDKVMLKYCGRRLADSSPDESHSCSFESMSDHEKDHCDSLFSGNRTFDSEERCAELGFTTPLPMQNGPWKTHRARDEHGNPECPLLFFKACVCGFFGSRAHPPSNCPFYQAMEHL